MERGNKGGERDGSKEKEGRRQKNRPAKSFMSWQIRSEVSDFLKGWGSSRP